MAGLQWRRHDHRADGNVTVNNPQAIAAFERAKGWVGTISPAGVTTYKEEEARGVWQAGNAAFMRNWPYAYAPGQEADSAIKDKFDVTLIPMGEGEGRRTPTTSAAGRSWSRSTRKNQPAAIAFAQYLTSTEAPEVLRDRAEPPAHDRRAL